MKLVSENCGQAADGSEAGEEQILTKAVKTSTLIALGMMSGVIGFLGIAVVLTGGNFSTEIGVLSIVAAAVAFVMCGVHLLIPGVIARSQIVKLVTDGWKDRTDAERIRLLCQVWQTQLIVGIAVLEGTVFFNIIVLIREKSFLSVAAIAVLLPLMLAKIPNRLKAEWWVQERQREIESQSGF
ncbi:MAG: hypothetical protein ACK526_00980 [Planctomyces sp.]